MTRLRARQALARAEVLRSCAAGAPGSRGTSRPAAGSRRSRRTRRPPTRRAAARGRGSRSARWRGPRRVAPRGRAGRPRAAGPRYSTSVAGRLEPVTGLSMPPPPEAGRRPRPIGHRVDRRDRVRGLPRLDDGDRRFADRDPVAHARSAPPKKSRPLTCTRLDALEEVQVIARRRARRAGRGVRRRRGRARRSRCPRMRRPWRFRR